MIAQAITNETNHFQLKPDMYIAKITESANGIAPERAKIVLFFPITITPNPFVVVVITMTIHGFQHRFVRFGEMSLQCIYNTLKAYRGSFT